MWTVQVYTAFTYHTVMRPKDEDGMANSVDPDQTAPLGLYCICLDIPVWILRIEPRREKTCLRGRLKPACSASEAR